MRIPCVMLLFVHAASREYYPRVSSSVDVVGSRHVGYHFDPQPPDDCRMHCLIQVAGTDQLAALDAADRDLHAGKGAASDFAAGIHLDVGSLLGATDADIDSHHDDGPAEILAVEAAPDHDFVDIVRTRPVGSIHSVEFRDDDCILLEVFVADVVVTVAYHWAPAGADTIDNRFVGIVDVEFPESKPAVVFRRIAGRDVDYVGAAVHALVGSLDESEAVKYVQAEEVLLLGQFQVSSQGSQDAAVVWPALDDFRPNGQLVVTAFGLLDVDYCMPLRDLLIDLQCGLGHGRHYHWQTETGAAFDGVG